MKRCTKNRGSKKDYDEASKTRVVDLQYLAKLAEPQNIATLVVAIATVAALFIHKKSYKSQNDNAKRNINYLGMLEIMKFFNDPTMAQQRDVIIRAYREQKLYNENDEIVPVYPNYTQNIDLRSAVASVRGSFDQMGKIVKEDYIKKEEFLDMYVESIIIMGKILKRHIDHERKERKHDHFAVNFESIFNDAKSYWKENMPGAQEPEPY